MSGAGDETVDVPRDSRGPSRKRRRGPAPMPEADRREYRVSVYLSAAELAALDDLRGGVSRGHYLRTAALETPPPHLPAINLEAWRSLAPVASHLNQLARRVNVEDAPAIDVVHTELQKFRAALIGFSADEVDETEEDITDEG